MTININILPMAVAELKTLLFFSPVRPQRLSAFVSTMLQFHYTEKTSLMSCNSHLSMLLYGKSGEALPITRCGPPDNRKD